jgi:glutathione synthase/RimK-type ligase-like ATP-grasp enzyme
MLEKLDLMIAQEFVPTEFDWRIGVLDRPAAVRVPLLHGRRATGRSSSATPVGKKEDVGRAETVPIEMAPTRVVKTALKAANHVGKGCTASI